MLKVNTDEKECGVNGEQKETNTKELCLEGQEGLTGIFLSKSCLLNVNA